MGLIALDHSRVIIIKTIIILKMETKQKQYYVKTEREKDSSSLLYFEIDHRLHVSDTFKFQLTINVL